MLKKWEKLEELINRILEKLKLFMVATFFKVVPPKVFEKYKQGQTWLITKSTEKVQQVIAWGKKQHELKDQRKEAFKKKVEATKAFFQQVAAKLKELKQWRPRIPKKQDFIDFWNFIKSLPSYGWKLLWFVSEEKKPFVATALAVLIPGFLIIGGLSLYLLKKSGYFRGPAAVVREYKKIRPDYYHQYARTMKIHSINFPVYVESVRGARMLRMDLTLTTSNKYTRNYLNKNYHLVQDRLNSRLEPMIPTFPIEEEGKKIIKAKVQEEIDKLIKELKIDGEVQSVHIHSILSG
jgi:flagellar basal body-associated protein FliL